MKHHQLKVVLCTVGQKHNTSSLQLACKTISIKVCGDTGIIVHIFCVCVSSISQQGRGGREGKYLDRPNLPKAV